VYFLSFSSTLVWLPKYHLVPNIALPRSFRCFSLLLFVTSVYRTLFINSCLIYFCCMWSVV
jgi:hypothetical protein